MKKVKNTLFKIICLCFCLSMTVAAADKLQLVQCFTGEDYLALYVRGISKNESITEVKIGQEMGEVKSLAMLGDGQVPIRTLVMIDNSISIKAADREKVLEIIQYLILNRKGNEKIAVAAFDETLHYLSDYSDKDQELKAALESLTYQNQETYMTDVLCNLLENEFKSRKEESFDRIIMISDGMDSKEIGFTKDELFLDIQTSQIPIYTIGCGGKNNEEALENMFALSRRSNAESILLSKVEDSMQVIELLAEDRDIVRIELKLPDNVMDGSKKAVQLHAGDAELSCEALMPQKVIVQKEEAIEEVNVSDRVKEEDIENEETKKEDTSAPLVLVIGIFAGIFLLILGITAGIWTMKRRKQNRLMPPPEPMPVVMPPITSTCTLVLKDIENPVHTYQTDLSNEKAAVIGRDESCDIILSFDRRVSGRHCEIGMSAGELYIQDLHSTNGTFINDNRINRVPLVDGNKLGIGKTQLRVTLRSYSATSYGDDEAKTIMV